MHTTKPFLNKALSTEILYSLDRTTTRVPRLLTFLGKRKTRP